MKPVRIGICLLFFAACAPVRAENFALLAGVSHYAFGATHPWVNLEGPENDIASLRQALMRLGFAPERITVLKDEDAGRQAVLDSLRAMVKQARPGDLVFFYFSGHGTSGFDEHFKQIAAQIGPDTGALIPYDIDPESPERAIASLIVGRRDLRPILLSLNPQARGLVVLDACYSQDSAKGIDLRGTPRYLDLRELFSAAPPAAGPAAAPSIASIEQELLLSGAGGSASPYPNVVLLSAAAKSETAADMSSRLLATGKVQTVDGKPHGAFTNSLLKGLAGAADTDHDGKITIDELYRFAREDVRSVFKHTPQMLEPENGNLASEISLRSLGAESLPSTHPPDAPRAHAASEDHPTLVKLEGAAAALRGQLEAAPGILLTQGEYDLLVRQSPTGYDLYDGSRTLIRQFPESDTAGLIKRIAAEPDLQRLIGLRFAHQDFNAAVEVTSPAGQGSYRNRQRLQVSVQTAESGYLLLLDVDSTGVISVLYPGKPQEQEAVAAGKRLPVIDTSVGAPFGKEFLKLFVFRKKPAQYARWSCRAVGTRLTCPEIAPGTPEFRDLFAMLTEADGGRAQTVLPLVTTGDQTTEDTPHRGLSDNPASTVASLAGSAYQSAKVWDISGDYGKALDGYRKAAGRTQDTRLQAVILYQEARMTAALGRRDEARPLAAASLAKLPTVEGKALANDLNRAPGPVASDTIARSLSTRSMTLVAEPAVDLPIEFEFNRDTMTSEGRLQANELGKALAGSEFASVRFLVVGHTDCRGAPTYNQTLSEKRALAVVRFLAASFGIAETRLRAEGHGSREPISLGDTEDDYRMNRRVEVRVDAR